MEKKNIDWGSLGFAYMPTDKRFVANYKDGAWDEGTLSDDPMITMIRLLSVNVQVYFSMHRPVLRESKPIQLRMEES